jgi:hypothetical protein
MSIGTGCVCALAMDDMAIIATTDADVPAVFRFVMVVPP